MCRVKVTLFFIMYRILRIAKRISILVWLLYNSSSVYCQSTAIENKQTIQYSIDSILTTWDKYGRHEKEFALQNSKDAYDLSRSIKDNYRIARSLHFMAKSYFFTESYLKHKTIELCKQSNEVCEQVPMSLPVKKIMTENYLWISETERFHKDLAQGKIDANTGINLAIEINDSALIAQFYSVIGHIEQAYERYDSSLFYFGKSKKIMEQIKHPELYIEIEKEGYVYVLQKLYDRAIPQIYKAIELAAEAEDYHWEMIGYMDLAESYEAKGDYVMACETMKELARVRGIIYTNYFHTSNAEIKAKFELDNAELKLELFQKDQLLVQQELKNRNNQLVVYGFFIIMVTLGLLFYFLFKRKQNINIQLEQKNKLMYLEKKALQAQMNPHFIFNALNSVQTFISSNSREQSEHYMGMFAKLMRSVLNSSREECIMLSKELESLTCYLELEQLRCDHKFDYEIIMPDNLEVDFIKITPMLIQPYIENAIIHGVLNKEGNSIITITIKEHNDTLQCIIEDDGVGREAARIINAKSKSDHKSYGVLITQERLDMLNKKHESTFNVEMEDLKDESGKGSGTKVIIEIPIEN
jgi:tetratricopeptide (TPR) repeat protein